ncbi:MAG TPA: histidine phosphatase family protein [Rhizomicrobium sp.]|jgi:phosphohistidine phosphatase|nr:histidine phosphatase family protein [Rhizomicrobium sp.]
MKRLLVLRHAKAAAHDEKHDKERALVERGREDAARMGRAMRERGYLPDLVLCSSATRTVETWEHVAPELRTRPETEFLDALYDAAENTILACIHAVERSAPALLYIGHNPGLERFARMLVRSPVDSDERRRAGALAQKFPTAALAVLDFDSAEWAAIERTTGRLSDFIMPAELKDK